MMHSHQHMHSLDRS